LSYGRKFCSGSNSSSFSLCALKYSTANPILSCGYQ